MSVSFSHVHENYRHEHNVTLAEKSGEHLRGWLRKFTVTESENILMVTASLVQKICRGPVEYWIIAQPGYAVYLVDVLEVDEFGDWNCNTILGKAFCFRPDLLLDSVSR